MTKSELIKNISAQYPHLSVRDIEMATRQMLDYLSDALAEGELTGYCKIKQASGRLTLQKTPSPNAEMLVEPSFAEMFEESQSTQGLKPGRRRIAVPEFPQGKGWFYGQRRRCACLPAWLPG